MVKGTGPKLVKLEEITLDPDLRLVVKLKLRK